MYCGFLFKRKKSFGYDYPNDKNLSFDGQQRACKPKFFLQLFKTICNQTNFGRRYQCHCTGVDSLHLYTCGSGCMVGDRSYVDGALRFTSLTKTSIRPASDPLIYICCRRLGTDHKFQEPLTLKFYSLFPLLLFFFLEDFKYHPL